MKKTVLLVDGNNQAHRAFHKFSSVSSTKFGKAIKTSVVWGLPYILNSHLKELKPTRTIIAWDGKKDPERLAVLPEYKLGRASMAEYEDFQNQKSKVMEFFCNLGIKQYFDSRFEADDIIYRLARIYHKKGWNVIILSNDKDFHQLLKPGISIWNSGLRVRLSHLNLHKYFKYTPEKALDFLILDGDTSDNIKGYPGVGEKTAIKLLDEFGSIQQFLKSDKEFNRIEKAKLLEVYKRNQLLIDLKFFYLNFIKGKKIPRPYKGVKKPKLDLAFIEEYCSIYNIKTFNTEAFLKSFKSLK